MATKQIKDVLNTMRLEDFISAAEAAERERLANQRLEKIELADMQRRAIMKAADHNDEADYPEYVSARNAKRKSDRYRRWTAQHRPTVMKSEKEE